MQNYRFTILGAGLAGLSISVELSLAGIPHVLIDTGRIGGGASGTPAGLLNPASGQKARFPVFAPECIAAFDRLFQLVSMEVPCSEVILNRSILRPAMDESLSDNFQNSIQSGDWPSGWVSWVNQDQLGEFGVISGLGGMLVHKGYAVDFRKWTKAMSEFTSTKMAQIFENAIYDIQKISDGYNVTCNDHHFQTQNIIDCTGASSMFKSRFKWAAVKGQTRTIRMDLPSKLNTAVSGYGYAVKSHSEIILGSTYEHHFENDAPTVDKDKMLLKKASMFSKAKLGSELITERWAGVRVSTPDRLPAIGSLPEEPGFHYVFGFGSKGLYYSAWVASLLVDHIVNGNPIPAALHVSRLRKE